MTIDDLWSLRSSDRSGHISAEFQKAWDKEIRKHEAGRGEPSLVKSCVISFGGPFAFAAVSLDDFFKQASNMSTTEMTRHEHDEISTWFALA